MSRTTSKVIWLFRLAGLLKIGFLIFLFLLEQYRDKLIREDSGSGFLSGLTIDFPWYFDALVYTLTICYFFSLLIINIAAWWPCSGVGKWIRHRKAGILILTAEIILLIAGGIAATVQLSESFRPKSHNLLDRAFHFLLDTKNTSEFERADKLNGLNLLIPVIASLLVVAVFRKTKRAMAEQCRALKGFP